MTRPPIHLVLVDFDDTLVETAPRFARARADLFTLLAGLGFDPDHVDRVHHHEVDPVMRSRHGFGPQRMAEAFRETYLRLCEQAGRAAEASVLDRCGRLGDGVVGTPPALDGALAALRRLAARLPTAIYTQAGNAEYQLGCLREAGALDAVGDARVRVVPVKTTDAFRETSTNS